MKYKRITVFHEQLVLVLRAVFLYGLHIFLKMRILYTILFFVDTLLLVFLTYLFLQKIDTGGNAWILILIFAGIVASIFLLVLLLKSYIRQPPGRRRN